MAKKERKQRRGLSDEEKDRRLEISRFVSKLNPVELVRMNQDSDSLDELFRKISSEYQHDKYFQSKIRANLNHLNNEIKKKNKNKSLKILRKSRAQKLSITDNEMNKILDIL